MIGRNSTTHLHKANLERLHREFIEKLEIEIKRSGAKEFRPSEVEPAAEQTLRELDLKIQSLPRE